MLYTDKLLHVLCYFVLIAPDKVLFFNWKVWGGGHINFGVDPVGIGIKGHFFVCTISCEPGVGFLPNFHGYIIGT